MAIDPDSDLGRRVQAALLSAALDPDDQGSITLPIRALQILLGAKPVVDLPPLAAIQAAAEAPYLVPGWLDAELKKPGRSQSGLARELGIDASGVNRICAGKREIKLHEAKAIRAYLDRTAEG